MINVRKRAEHISKQLQTHLNHFTSKHNTHLHIPVYTSMKMRKGMLGAERVIMQVMATDQQRTMGRRLMKIILGIQWLGEVKTFAYIYLFCVKHKSLEIYYIFKYV